MMRAMEEVATCAGGPPQPGPIFQALPEPLPLPPLPQPERPAEAMTPSMAPETAPAGLPQPGTVLQVLLCPGLWVIHQIVGTVGRPSYAFAGK